MISIALLPIGTLKKEDKKEFLSNTITYYMILNREKKNEKINALI